MPSRAAVAVLLVLASACGAGVGGGRPVPPGPGVPVVAPSVVPDASPREPAQSPSPDPDLSSSPDPSGAPSATDADVSGQQVSTSRYTVTLPDGWEVSGDGDNDTEVTATAPGGGAPASLSVRVSSVDDVASAADLGFLIVFDELGVRGATDYRDGQEGPTRVGRFPEGYVLSYRATDDAGRDYRFRTWSAIADRVGLTVTYAAPSDRHDTLLPDAESTVASFGPPDR